MIKPLRRIHSRAQSGFTLVELLIVVAIVGLLAGIAIPGLFRAIDKSKQTSTSALMKAFGQSLEVYNADNQSYPMVVNVPALIPHLSPYADSLKPYDDWKNPLSYRTTGASYTIECFGKDGIDGLDVTPTTRYFFDLDIVYADGAFVNGVE